MKSELLRGGLKGKQDVLYILNLVFFCLLKFCSIMDDKTSLA